MKRIAYGMALGWLLAMAVPLGARAEPLPALFVTGDRCMACHNGLVSPSGEDVSIGSDWRASMMANSARDPYWQAAVRREVMDHPSAAAEIEDECSICHMPMSRLSAKASGRLGQIFAHLPARQASSSLATDGVSCVVCHQIQSQRLGTPASYTGGFVIDVARPLGKREIFGPFQIDRGRRRIMQSSTGFVPAQGPHLARSELCATCHTLYTRTLGPGGKVIGQLPEQVPYLEWKHSAYRASRSCQSCHMPAVPTPMPITSVLGEPRPELSRHVFRGGNFFMLNMLARHSGELGVQALPQELALTAHRTVAFLQSESARLQVRGAKVVGGRLRAEVAIENLAGHKLPTAYPSRRVWIHFVVRDARGKLLFESGALSPNGAIAGNDNDRDARRYEPHHARITRPDQVQIYESIMVTPDGAVTTGLLSAIRFVKDNRLLPRGFDKSSAHADIAVQGAAREDADFVAGGDRVPFEVAVGRAQRPLGVVAELVYQPIAYRWAHNLDRYGAAETRRFVAYYAAMSRGSSVVLARARATVE